MNFSKTSIILTGLALVCWIMLSGLAESAASDNSRSADGLTVEKLQNAEYQLRCGKVKLIDGDCVKDEKRRGYCCSELSDQIAFGDLNGDGIADAVAIFWTQVGYRRIWVELAVIINQDGTPKQIAYKVLGMNKGAQSIAIKSGEIVLELGKYAHGDPICCPSLSIMKKYRLSGKNLVLLP